MATSLKTKEEVEDKGVLMVEGRAGEKRYVEQVIGGETLSPVQIARLLLLIAFTLLVCHLVVIHLASKVLAFFANSSNYPLYKNIYYTLYNQFHLALEGNISTYFSAFNLALASVLLYVIHKTGSRATYHWMFLSVFFLFLSVDESAQLHETFGGLAGGELNKFLDEVPPFLSWAWMVPYSVLAMVFGLYFFNFTWRLPGKTRNLFFISGSVYVFAALGLEFLEAHFDTVYGPDNLINKFLFPCEEVLEMVGVIIFVYALLDYLKLKNRVVQLSFADTK